MGLLLAAVLVATHVGGWWSLSPLSFTPPAWLASLLAPLWGKIGAGVVVLLILFGIHHGMRLWSRRSTLSHLDDMQVDERSKRELHGALRRNSGFIHSIFRPEVVGWHMFTRRRLHKVLANADHAIQELNDRYTRPSGDEPEPTETQSELQSAPAPSAQAGVDEGDAEQHPPRESAAVVEEESGETQRPTSASP